MKNKKAFTLIELLVVVLIIGILAAIALPQYQTAVLKSRLQSSRPLLKSLANAQDMYKLATGSYTANFDDLSITIPGNCSETSCVLNDKDFLLITINNIIIYFNATSQDTNQLSLTIILEPDGVPSSNTPVSKGQLICYDRGNARFSKACQSLSPINSFDWSGGKAWIIP